MRTTALSDAELLAQARDGDEAAFTELYVRHHGAALRVARAYARAGDPEDLVNGAFERMLGALRRGSGPTEAFRAYLFVTLRRLAADQFAKLHDEPVEDVPEPVRADDQDPALDRAERHLVVAAYESLPERTQAVLWQTEVEGRQPKELAGLFGMSANAVAALTYRAREKLRQAYLQAHLQAAPRPECEPHRSRLGAYIREGLGQRDQTTTAAHLDGCEACQSLVGELLDVNRLLRKGLMPLFESVAGQVAAAAGATSAAAAVAAGGTAAVVWPRIGQRLKSNATIVAGALALIAAVAFALVATTSDDAALDPGSPPPEEEAASSPPPDAETEAPPSSPSAPSSPEPEGPAPSAPDEPGPTTSPPQPTPGLRPPVSGGPGPVTPPPPPGPGPTTPPTTPPPPPTVPPAPPPPALVVVWVDIQGTLQITLTNNTGLPTDGLVLEVNLAGGAVVSGPPVSCDSSLALLTTVSCGVGGLAPGESRVVQIPVSVSGSGQSAQARTCSAPVLGLVCLDVLAEITASLPF